MAILVKGTDFSDGTQVTAAALDALVDSATFASGAVDDVSTQLSGGAIIVKDGGLLPAKLSTGGPSWTSGGVLSATSLQNTPIGSATPSTGAFTTLSATSTSTVSEILERATVTASAPSATTNVDFLTTGVVYYTSNTANNWILNVRGDSGTTLNTVMATGDVATVVVMATNSTTAYYPTAFRVDGNSVTPRWLGGTAPTSGNASSTDIYTYSIVKTGSATFTVFAAQSRFA